MLLHRLQNEGLVIGGTSAGAAMMPENMIAEGDSETNARMDVVEITAIIVNGDGIEVVGESLDKVYSGLLTSVTSNSWVKGVALICDPSQKWLGFFQLNCLRKRLTLMVSRTIANKASAKTFGHKAPKPAPFSNTPRIIVIKWRNGFSRDR